MIEVKIRFNLHVKRRLPHADGRFGCHQLSFVNRDYSSESTYHGDRQRTVKDGMGRDVSFLVERG